MKTHGNKTRRLGGFTLIELLTVVAIIGLLVGMVVPTIRAVLENKTRMQMQVRIAALNAGCSVYKMEGTGNKYYPGQDPDSFGALTSGTNTSGKYPNCQNAGSALLARCLFTDANGLFPTSSYGRLERDMLGTVGVSTSVPNSIIDNASEIMAILYYPSRLGSKGVSTQYEINDNSKYVNSTNSSGVINIRTYVKPSTASTNTPVRQDGLFVITAAGTDRLYFSATAVDNFNK
jgi:prepilin-type N-terminal cleavage/methylation domain-containing protein